nr:synaptobrevin, longin-like domain protein [Tanacetum cinerariifolium]
MVSILEKTEHNTNFHQIVDFLEASHIRIETTNQETKILATVDGQPRTISESSLRRHLRLNDEEGISSLPDAKLFENLSLMGYNILPNQRFTFQKGQFSHQWKFLIHTIMQCLSPKSTGFNEFSSNIATAVVCLATNRVYNFSKMIFNGTVRNINIKGEAFPTVSSLDAGQGRENIAKTSSLPHESSPRVTFLDADEGSMQQRIHELMELCTSLQRQQSQMAAKIKDQDLEISELKARVKSLEDKDKRNAEPTQEDAPIIEEIIEIGEELGAHKSTELGSIDTEEMVNVLTLIEAANILTSRGAAASVSPADVLSAVGVPTVSGSFPTVSAIFTIASVIDAQVAREMEEEFARKNQRLSKQLAKDSEIARLHAEEELKIMIEGLDRSNEVISKHLQEYEQAEADLSVGEKIELINELVKYQDHRAKILKYQAQ